MTHPEELLAAYVDGTLGDDERAVVDAHLATCERCRGEVELSRAALTALASLVSEPVPFGVTEPVLAEAGRRFEQRRGVVWQRLQWGAGLATAAALVLVVAISLTGGDEDGLAPAATGASAGAPAPGMGAAEIGAGPPLGLERQPGVDYDDTGIRAVVDDAVADLAAADEGAEASGVLAEDAAARDAATQEALACVERSGGPSAGPRDTPVRVIVAEYDGTRAYIAVFAQGPGAGQAADHVVVWVVATEDCRILTTASRRIPSG